MTGLISLGIGSPSSIGWLLTFGLGPFGAEAPATASPPILDLYASARGAVSVFAAARGALDVDGSARGPLDLIGSTEN